MSIGPVPEDDGFAPQPYTYADGRTCAHPDGEMHDCKYVQQRNRLIGAAERLAYKRLIEAGEEPRGGAFGRVFMAAMTELWGRRQ